MEQDLFQLLPSEITFNILSRLHVRAIATSKCVCKPWLDLLSTDDFINSHLSKSVPALALTVEMTMEEEEERSVWCKVFEFKDGDEDEVDDIERRYIPLKNGDFSERKKLLGVANGLLLLLENCRTLYICNPITREYVELCCPVIDPRSIYGFGASKITGQHKVVQITHCLRPSGSKCDVDVYTLETRSWRRFGATAELDYGGIYGAYVNGNLHQLSQTIACFDLETECFSMFSAPPLEETAYNKSICALKDYLCVCAFMPSEDYDFVINIWLMKEYGVEKSWTKEYVICIRPDLAMYEYNHFARDGWEHFYPIKVFKNGDILISGGDIGWELFHYSNKTQTAQKIGVLEPPRGFFCSSLLLTLSFLSLKRNLGMENVISF